MIRKQKEGLEWLEFDLLQPFPEVVHGVFLRSGGISEEAYSSLNVGGGSGDCKDKIAENREKVQKALGLASLISCLQVHGDTVKELSELSLDEGCDGIVTREKNQGLMIKHADCQAAIFYDPVNKIIANIHSGWRGSVENIYGKTVEKMVAMGSRPEDLIVCISPSLGPERAEFVNFETEFPFPFWAFQIRPFYFDFWEISRSQLEEAGVPSVQIEIAGICSYDNPKDFYSYRRDKVTGRNATVVALI